jgi:hypothetical protein
VPIGRDGVRVGVIRNVPWEVGVAVASGWRNEPPEASWLQPVRTRQNNTNREKSTLDLFDIDNPRVHFTTVDFIAELNP